MIFLNISEIIFTDFQNIRLYGFKLHKNNEEITLYHKNKKIIKYWIKVLKLYCVAKDFYQSYYILEKLGVGHFAQVFKVESIKKNYLFAAKIINKNEEFEKNKVKYKKKIKKILKQKTVEVYFYWD